MKQTNLKFFNSVFLLGVFAVYAITINLFLTSHVSGLDSGDMSCISEQPVNVACNGMCCEHSNCAGGGDEDCKFCNLEKKCSASACGISCVNKTSCAGGDNNCMFCGAQKTCVDSACDLPCSANQDCAGGNKACQYCVSGKCLKSACDVPCKKSTDCAGAADDCNYCLNSKCDRAACGAQCDTQADCAGAKDGCNLCNEGQCSQSACGLDCLSRNDCVGGPKNTCLICGQGLKCSDKICGAKCSKHSDCVGGIDSCPTCNNNGFCDSLCGKKCSSDTDCAGAEEDCTKCDTTKGECVRSNMCGKPCTNDSSCAGGADNCKTCATTKVDMSQLTDCSKIKDGAYVDIWGTILWTKGTTKVSGISSLDMATWKSTNTYGGRSNSGKCKNSSDCLSACDSSTPATCSYKNNWFKGTKKLEGCVPASAILSSSQKQCVAGRNIAVNLKATKDGSSTYLADEIPCRDVVEFMVYTCGTNYHRYGICSTEPFNQICMRNCARGAGLNIYFDAQCNISKTPPAGVEATYVVTKGYVSPVSLVIKDAPEVAPVITSSFQLEPSKKNQWVIWRASSKYPLVVYDPQKSGKITSSSQLFGANTFGKIWKDGFEALASLDQNKDGKIAGKELKNLSLWFDKNQNAVSDKGEVVDLRSYGITELFYKKDGNDVRNADILVSQGYVLVKNNKSVVGSAIDWFTALYDSKSAAQAALEEFKKAQSNPRKRVETTGEMNAKIFEGMWKWELNQKYVKQEELARGSNMSGFFVLAADEAGDKIIDGTSIVHLSAEPNQSGIASIVSSFKLENTSAYNEQGVQFLSWTIEDKNTGLFSENIAEISADGTTLYGVSREDLKNPKTFVRSFRHYTWKATKLEI
ncbi:MAG: hypothetical protein LBE20_04890 [Deltaproteobacteria bacterium]|nr:hypothetical protein [Deltaproteobacteria bacterium]